MIGTAVSTYILACIAVVLRVYCRKVKGVNLWYDDWSVIAALVGIDLRILYHFGRH